MAARRVRWTQRAIRDAHEIARQIALDSAEMADEMVDRFFEASASLSNLTDRGRKVPELNREDVRELLVDSWRLIYRRKGSTVWIVGILHQKMLFRKNLGRRFRRG